MGSRDSARSLAHLHDSTHDLHVPVTRIRLDPSPDGTENPPVTIYRTEGPGSDPVVGLPALRERWIADRDDTDEYEGRARNLHDDGRSAIRRMNQMHGAYAISNDDMRYVLCTFVVVPIRWLDRFGWRPLSEAERRASANYYRELGRHMNIRDRPETHEEFAAVLDAYEREHFAYSPGGRAVSDATLSLLLGFYPRPLRPLLRRATMALLDQPLREAFAYPPPDRVTSALTVFGLRARAAIERRLPPRIEPHFVRDRREFAIYPDGYRVDELGTFPR